MGKAWTDWESLSFQKTHFYTQSKAEFSFARLYFPLNQFVRLCSSDLPKKCFTKAGVQLIMAHGRESEKKMELIEFSTRTKQLECTSSELKPTDRNQLLDLHFRLFTTAAFYLSIFRVRLR